MPYAMIGRLNCTYTCITSLVACNPFIVFSTTSTVVLNLDNFLSLLLFFTIMIYVIVDNKILIIYSNSRTPPNSILAAYYEKDIQITNGELEMFSSSSIQVRHASYLAIVTA